MFATLSRSLLRSHATRTRRPDISSWRPARSLHRTALAETLAESGNKTLLGSTTTRVGRFKFPDVGDRFSLLRPSRAAGPAHGGRRGGRTTWDGATADNHALPRRTRSRRAA